MARADAGPGGRELRHGALDEGEVDLLGRDALARLRDAAVERQDDASKQQHDGARSPPMQHEAPLALGEARVPGAHQAPALRTCSRPR